jgi:hypothetical protein
VTRALICESSFRSPIPQQRDPGVFESGRGIRFSKSRPLGSALWAPLGVTNLGSCLSHELWFDSRSPLGKLGVTLSLSNGSPSRAKVEGRVTSY